MCHTRYYVKNGVEDQIINLEWKTYNVLSRLKMLLQSVRIMHHYEEKTILLKKKNNFFVISTRFH